MDFTWLTVVNGFFQLFKNLNFIGKIYEKTKYGKDYYFEEYDKQITIFKDGHGILTNTMKIKVLNPADFCVLHRRLGLSDSKPQAVFSSLEEMLQTSIPDRFDSLGFWYSCSDDIVTGIEEFYYSDDDSSRENVVLKKNPKELRWRFNLNSNKIQKNKTYTIQYAISVPGMFTIDNGYFNENWLSLGLTPELSSSLKVKHTMKKLNYIIAIEKDVHLKSDVVCDVVGHKKTGTEIKRHLHGKMHDDLFYRKYEFNIKNPQINSSIRITCDLENTAKVPALHGKK